MDKISGAFEKVKNYQAVEKMKMLVGMEVDDEESTDVNNSTDESSFSFMDDFNRNCTLSTKQESYDKTLAECQERGENKAPNQIFFETVGGRKEGWVHGLGTSADLYFERSSRGGDSSSSSCTPSMLSQLSAMFEEEILELRRERERIKNEREEERLARQMEREEERRVNEECLAQMRKTMESYNQMMSQCGGSFPFTRP
ncbi:hypothetical protein BVRB_4g077690 isoform D [Beta vulgaris subsp. vulgaris]|uniref:uncharacterized protein LOC104890481 isoform X1 n=1 Tax=Beta vulgaris subsp. vulgaris TaxID=3555 RepID=UPI0005402E9C|nr:uncharacterized protein LOC104890481 isoform X1 [Beta vulgaris subsp. vulgaris]KMT13931.1 hypothetical protein BVRB_4g077690 isoform D [Beta vulgaris subsp. vulgaris]